MLMTNNELLGSINTGATTSLSAAKIFTRDFCRGLNQQDIRVFMVAVDKRKNLAVANQNERAVDGRHAMAAINERQAARWETIFTNLYEFFSYERGTN